MRTPVLIALLTVVMLGCGDDAGDQPTVDAAPEIDATPLPTTCNTETQADCPADYKCTLVRVMTSPPIIRRCVRLQGSVPEGAACITSGTDIASFGHDNCAIGLYCYTGFCRKLCAGPSGCGAGTGCAQYATATDGLCRKTCALLTAGECPSGQTCDSNMTIGGPFTNYCRQIGTVPQGGSCFDGYCGLDQGCDRDNNCAPLCDANHACAVGTCDFAPLQPDYGACRGV